MMGFAAFLVILFTGASVDELVVLYSINVFITFSLSQLGMVRHWWQERANTPRWKKKLCINGFGLLLTGGILISLCIVKFFDGGWVTLFVTGLLVGVAFWVKRHYRQTQKKLHRLNELVAAALADEAVAGVENRPPPPCDPNARTAIFLVNGFNGLGLHTLSRRRAHVSESVSKLRLHPGWGAGCRKFQRGGGSGEFAGTFPRRRGPVCQLHDPPRFLFRSAHVALGTDIVDEAAKACNVIAEKFPQAQFFAGQLVFKDESTITRWLHNHTVFELQRRLYQIGRAMLILPIQV